jgi:hypothetical protein
VYEYGFTLLLYLLVHANLLGLAFISPYTYSYTPISPSVGRLSNIPRIPWNRLKEKLIFVLAQFMSVSDCQQPVLFVLRHTEATVVRTDGRG